MTFTDFSTINEIVFLYVEVYNILALHCLKVHMVRRRGSAFRPVIEYRKLRQHSCQLNHVLDSVTNPLGDMLFANYSQMRVGCRIRVS